MNQRDTAADRIRPFLEAMERSIDAAKRERTREDPSSPAATDVRSEGGSAQADDQPQAFDPTRMKARPKRRFTA